MCVCEYVCVAVGSEGGTTSDGETKEDDADPNTLLQLNLILYRK